MTHPSEVPGDKPITITRSVYDRLQETVRIVERLNLAGPGTRPHGFESHDFFDAVIVNQGDPPDLFDFSNNRYWIRPAYVANEGGTRLDKIIWAPYENDPATAQESRRRAYVATNDAEEANGTHLLPTTINQHVQVYVRRDRDVRDILEPGDTARPRPVSRYYFSLVPPVVHRWLRITGKVSVGTNIWQYTARGQTLGAAGFDDGPVDDLFDNVLNTIELGNTGAGIEGHGVDIDGSAYPDTFAPVPIGNGARVRAWLAGGEAPPAGQTDSRLWFFQGVNNDDGTCE